MSGSRERQHFILSDFEDQNVEPKCTVYLPHNLEKQDLLEFPAFKNWLGRLLKNLALQEQEGHTFNSDKYKLTDIDVQAVDWFGNGRIGFVKIQAKVQNGEEGEEKRESLPGAVFLRGGSVGILFIVEPWDEKRPNEHFEDDQFVILTIQPRIAAGSLAFAEIPAGMLDGSGDFTGKAAAEIYEEVGIEIKSGDLTNMSEVATSDIPLYPYTTTTSGTNLPSEDIQNSMYPSAGSCDEFMPLLLCQKRLTLEKIEELKGKATGLRDEGEKITLKVVPFKDLWKEGGRDAKALAALGLYHGLRSANKLPPMPAKPDSPESDDQRPAKKARES